MPRRSRATLLAFAVACGVDPSTEEAALAVPGTAAADDAGGAPSPVRVDELMVLSLGGARCRQWLELVNVGSTRLSLRALGLRAGPPWRQRNASLAACPALGAGERLLVGDCTAAERRWAGGVAVACSWGDWQLPTDGGEIALVSAGVAHPQVRYGPDAPAPLPEGGRALARQADGRWCSVLGPAYDGIDQGSPGVANPGCWGCREGDGWRALRVPPPGCLRLFAVQADPEGPDAGREWVVLRATCTAPVDLAYLRMEVTARGRVPRTWRLRHDGCTPMAAGAVLRLAVGRSRRGPAPRVPFWQGPTLPNAAATYRLGNVAGEVVDAATFPLLPHHAGAPRVPGPAVAWEVTDGPDTVEGSDADKHPEAADGPDVVEGPGAADAPEDAGR